MGDIREKLKQKKLCTKAEVYNKSFCDKQIYIMFGFTLIQI